MNDSFDRSRRAAVYARVACADQERATFEPQEQACRALAAKKGFAVSGVFSDHVSGNTPPRLRLGYAELINAAGQGDHDVILVSDLDRISRDPITVEQEVRALGKEGREVFSTDGDSLRHCRTSARRLPRISLTVPFSEGDEPEEGR